MPYFANKPAPTPPNLLPSPKSSGVGIKKNDEKAKKRKLANLPTAESGELVRGREEKGRKREWKGRERERKE